MTVCGQAQYRHDKVATNGEIISPSDYQWLCSNDQCVVGKRTTDSSGQTHGDCGKIKLASVACSSTQTNDCLSGIEYSSALNTMNSTLTALWPYTDSWFNNLMTQSGAISVDDMISYPSSGISPGDIGSYLGNVALNYYYALEQLAYSTTTDEGSGSASGIYTIEDSSNAGWISAGRYIANPPTSLNTSTTTVFDQNTFESMMFKVEEFIPTCTPNSCSSSICFVSDTYYKKIAEVNLNGRYQWNDAFESYIDVSKDYIDDFVSTSDGSSTNGSSGASSKDPYLDTAVSILYNYWLKYDKGAGPYGDFNLDLQSSVTKFSVFAKANFSEVDIGAYQRNLYVLLNRILEDVTGLKYFSNDNSQSYTSVSQNGSISVLKEKCGNLNEPDGCFASLVENKESLVKEGSGFIGIAVAVHEGNSVNPLSSAQFMGLQMLNHSLGNMSQTVSDIMDLNEKLSLAYFGAMMGIQMVYLPIYGLNAFVFQFTPVGPYIDQIVGGAVDALIKMITFYQRLDYVYVSLYQPLAGTLAQIMVSVGFIIGVYVAAIPTIYYLLGALSWLLSVIEGMVGAPLIALGMTVPRVGTLLGNAESSVVFLLKIFITPALLLCGLITGLLLSNVMLGLLNQAMIGFITGFLTSFSELGSGATTLVSVGLFSIFYAYIISSIVSNSYSIVFRLIDRTMQYIGGQVEQSGLEDMAKQAKGDLGGVGRAGAAGQPQVGNVEAGGMTAARTETKGENEEKPEANDFNGITSPFDGTNTLYLTMI